MKHMNDGNVDKNGNKTVGGSVDGNVGANQGDAMDMDIEACSSTDLTGLIPALPVDDAQLEAYESLYPHITPGTFQGKSEEK